MSKIKIMHETLANKIAAGEVVESCASVVKELVENSIDASARNIKVELLDAGIREIKVTDDGEGMSKADALVAFSRHATSKLLKEDDLFFINTLGFRGEALAAISSVSKATLITCDDSVGTKVVFHGGKLLSDEPIGAPVGTSISIANLFYNTPARLKFLKSEKTELSSITNFLEKLALSNPGIAITLTNNNKELIKTSGSDNLLKCIHEIYGLSISDKMIEIKGSNEDYEISGFIGKPEILKGNRNHFITITNRRIIRNNDLNRIINNAYYTYKPDNKYPIVILNIHTDPTLIDVNIHPTKQDIKFSKLNSLEEVVTNTIKDALYNTLLIPNMPLSDEKEIKTTEYIIPAQKESKIREEQTIFDFKEDIKEAKVNTKIKELLLYPIGLALGTYIVAENEEGIFLLDQHAAQERINYEKYLEALKNKEITKTALLIPITVELTSSEFLVLKENTDILTNMGFTMEEFGINTTKFSEHPTWLREGYEEESIRKIIDLIITKKDAFDLVKFNENIAITLACKMSIKANTHISREAIEEIINALVKCDNPYNCPHGRPTIIKFTTYELEKMFKRVV